MPHRKVILMRHLAGGPQSVSAEAAGGSQPPSASASPAGQRNRLGRILENSVAGLRKGAFGGKLFGSKRAGKLSAVAATQQHLLKPLGDALPAAESLADVLASCRQGRDCGSVEGPLPVSLVDLRHALHTSAHAIAVLRIGEDSTNGSPLHPQPHHHQGAEPAAINRHCSSDLHPAMVQRLASQASSLNTSFTVASAKVRRRSTIDHSDPLAAPAGAAAGSSSDALRHPLDPTVTALLAMQQPTAAAEHAGSPTAHKQAALWPSSMDCGNSSASFMRSLDQAVALDSHDRAAELGSVYLAPAPHSASRSVSPEPPPSMATVSKSRARTSSGFGSVIMSLQDPGAASCTGRGSAASSLAVLPSLDRTITSPYDSGQAKGVVASSYSYGYGHQGPSAAHGSSMPQLAVTGLPLCGSMAGIAGSSARMQPRQQLSAGWGSGTLAAAAGVGRAHADDNRSSAGMASEESRGLISCLRGSPQIEAISGCQDDEEEVEMEMDDGGDAAGSGPNPRGSKGSKSRLLANLLQGCMAPADAARVQDLPAAVCPAASMAAGASPFLGSVPVLPTGAIAAAAGAGATDAAAPDCRPAGIALAAAFAAPSPATEDPAAGPGPRLHLPAAAPGPLLPAAAARAFAPQAAAQPPAPAQPTDAQGPHCQALMHHQLTPALSESDAPGLMPVYMTHRVKELMGVCSLLELQELLDAQLASNPSLQLMLEGVLRAAVAGRAVCHQQLLVMPPLARQQQQPLHLLQPQHLQDLVLLEVTACELAPSSGSSTDSSCCSAQGMHGMWGAAMMGLPALVLRLTRPYDGAAVAGAVGDNNPAAAAAKAAESALPARPPSATIPVLHRTSSCGGGGSSSGFFGSLSRSLSKQTLLGRKDKEKDGSVHRGKAGKDRSLRGGSEHCPALAPEALPAAAATAGTPPPGSDLLRLREEASVQLRLEQCALAHVPSLVTIVALDGLVLYQNGRSVAYMGHAVGAGAAASSSPSAIHDPEHTLRRMFACDPTALDSLWEAVHSGKAWSGLVRMPQQMDLLGGSDSGSGPNAFALPQEAFFHESGNEWNGAPSSSRAQQQQQHLRHTMHEPPSQHPPHHNLSHCLSRSFSTSLPGSPCKAGGHMPALATAAAAAAPGVVTAGLAARPPLPHLPPPPPQLVHMPRNASAPLLRMPTGTTLPPVLETASWALPASLDTHQLGGSGTSTATDYAVSLDPSASASCSHRNSANGDLLDSPTACSQRAGYRRALLSPCSARAGQLMGGHHYPGSGHPHLHSHQQLTLGLPNLSKMSDSGSANWLAMSAPRKARVHRSNSLAQEEQGLCGSYRAMKLAGASSALGGSGAAAAGAAASGTSLGGSSLQSSSYCGTSPLAERAYNGLGWSGAGTAAGGTDWSHAGLRGAASSSGGRPTLLAQSLAAEATRSDGGAAAGFGLPPPLAGTAAASLLEQARNQGRTFSHAGSATAAGAQMQVLAQAQQPPSPSHGAAASSRSLAGEAGTSGAAFCWHEVEASLVEDVVTGQQQLVLVATDVTALVQGELEVRKVLDAYQRLLEEIYPRHVLEIMAANVRRAACTPSHLSASRAGLPPTTTLRTAASAPSASASAGAAAAAALGLQTKPTASHPSHSGSATPTGTDLQKRAPLNCLAQGAAAAGEGQQHVAASTAAPAAAAITIPSTPDHRSACGAGPMVARMASTDVLAMGGSSIERPSGGPCLASAGSSDGSMCTSQRHTNQSSSSSNNSAATHLGGVPQPAATASSTAIGAPRMVSAPCGRLPTLTVPPPAVGVASCGSPPPLMLHGMPGVVTALPQTASYSSQPSTPLASASLVADLAHAHECVTILFADIRNFTSMCNEVAPAVVMTFLNDLFTEFDALVELFGVYKVETIGDCYMVAGGLVGKDEDGFNTVAGVVDPLHANKVFEFAKAMLHAARNVALPTTGEPVQLRVGIHSGPVMSGVVGRKMPRFCLFGDTVNTASRLESTGQPGCIHVSAPTHALLAVPLPQYAAALPALGIAAGALAGEEFVAMGGIDVKGKGRMETYLYTPPDAPAAY